MKAVVLVLEGAAVWAEGEAVVWVVEEVVV